jgi:hypothetical protein
VPAIPPLDPPDRIVLTWAEQARTIRLGDITTRDEILVTDGTRKQGLNSPDGYALSGLLAQITDRRVAGMHILAVLWWYAGRKAGLGEDLGHVLDTFPGPVALASGDVTVGEASARDDETEGSDPLPSAVT